MARKSMRWTFAIVGLATVAALSWDRDSAAPDGKREPPSIPDLLFTAIDTVSCRFSEETPTPPALSQRKPPGNQRRPSDPQSHGPLWEVTRAKVTEPVLPILSGERVAYPVRLHPELLPSIRVGDRLALELPGFGSLDGVVERRVVSDNGERSFGGRLEVGGGRFQVVFTQADKAVLATVATPKGVYALEGMGASGQLFLDNPDEMIDGSLAETLPPHD